VGASTSHNPTGLHGLLRGIALPFYHAYTTSGILQMLALEEISFELYCILFAINFSLNLICMFKVMFNATVAQDLCFNGGMFSGYGLLGCDIV
jgi:hypothetical protein